jgi:hypothetical protein
LFLSFSFPEIGCGVNCELWRLVSLTLGTFDIGTSLEWSIKTLYLIRSISMMLLRDWKPQNISRRAGEGDPLPTPAPNFAANPKIYTLQFCLRCRTVAVSLNGRNEQTRFMADWRVDTSRESRFISCVFVQVICTHSVTQAHLI